MSIMNNLNAILSTASVKVIKTHFGYSPQPNEIIIQDTRKEFKGDVTLTCFQFTKYSKKSPEQTAELIGKELSQHVQIITDFNVVKGFLNLLIDDNYWINFFKENNNNNIQFGFALPNGKTIMVEYSSPNTNKPLHLGHIRNNLLGFSISNILKAAGNDVKNVQIINDRGIHICKSMVAWQKYGHGETPKSAGIKGDKLVGKYYVKFDQEYKKEVNSLISSGKSKEQAEQEAPIMHEAKEMLLKWEQKDEAVYDLWQKMNNWVYEGFEKTYETMGVSFDKLYYESNTYLLGKDTILKGLEKGVFYQKEDNSIWVDLIDEGLDEKLLLRSDGTSVYMTQDIGTAILRFEEFPKLSKQIYVVGSEQEYHFKVLFLILEKLGYKWAKECYHLSYGMVDLPSGKMKSREGTVVDADDLFVEMYKTAENHTKELGKVDDFSVEEAEKLYKILGDGALKFYLLKVDPKKRLLFNPQESIDFQGHTGPFIQYTYARIQAILKRAEMYDQNTDHTSLTPYEKDLIKIIYKYPDIIQQAASEYTPALVANYVYELAKIYNKFYTESPIFQEGMPTDFRVQLSRFSSNVIQTALNLLGIQVPDRM